MIDGLTCAHYFENYSHTFPERSSFGKADEVGPISRGQGHAAIRHHPDSWSDATIRGFSFTDGSQRRHQGCQGLGDVTVIHTGLVDLKLLSWVWNTLETREHRPGFTAPRRFIKCM